MTGPIAVTGAGGYIGGRLVHRLRADGHDVRPFVRHPVPWLPDAKPLDLAEAPVARIAGDLAGCEAVVHLAGASEVVAAQDPDGALAGTLVATRRTAEAAARAGVARFVQLSTVHVYGAALERQATVAEDTIPEPRHPYAIARLGGEHLAAAAGPADLVVLRLTNSVGAPIDVRVDRWSLVANDVCAQAAAGGPIRLRSSGMQWRDFVDLGAVCATIEAVVGGQVPAGTYNLGAGASHTVLELAELVADLAAPHLGARPAVEAPPHDGPVPDPVVVDVSRLARHVPTPSVPLSDSLRELLELCMGAAAASARTGRE